MQQVRKQFQNPRNEYRALPMEFDCSKPDESAAALVEGGWGGAHFHYPLGGSDYLVNEDGWKSFASSVRACRDRGLSVCIYDEMGYPSGRAGGLVLRDHPEFEAQGLFYDSTDVIVEKDPWPFEWRLPEGRPFYVAHCELDWNGMLAASPIDVTDKVSSGTLRLELPPGSWRIMAFVQNRLYEGTHASMTFGPYINVLDPLAVRRFIELTHEKYYAHCGGDFGKTIKAIFNDEVSMMSGYLKDETQPYPAIPWWDGLPARFQGECGEGCRDIRLALPALFNNAGTATAAYRCAFYSMLADTVAESFFRQVREWCAAHDVASAGHLVWEESLIYHANFYGSVFPSLRELDWPGIDVLGCGYGSTGGSHTDGGPVTPKLASSAAHLHGKPRTMSESFCFVTGKTPVEELLAHINWQWVLGINSLTTLSINDQYPTGTLRRLNDYTGRLSSVLTQGRFVADVAVLYPIASVWADFVPTRRHVHHLDDNPKAKDVDEAWRGVTRELLACQRDFDYVDEAALQQAGISSGTLRIGRNSYKALVLPHVTTLEHASLQQLEKFVSGGGTVISYETIPLMRADAGPTEEHRKRIEELWEGGARRAGRAVHVETMAGLRAALAQCGTPDLAVAPPTHDIYYQHRVLDLGDVYFVVNHSTSALPGEFTFRACGTAEVWNPEDGTMQSTDAVPRDGTSVLSLTLPPRSGRLVVFSH